MDGYIDKQADRQTNRLGDRDTERINEIYPVKGFGGHSLSFRGMCKTRVLQPAGT